MNSKQQIGFDYYKDGKNIFITGSGGVGKSFLLDTIIKDCKKYNINIGITSSTGVSATHINGVTINSFLRLGFGNQNVYKIYEKIKKNFMLYKKLLRLKVLIIDEISMIGKYLFNKINRILQLIKRNSKPFGGIQVILSGDFCQLKPVKSDLFCFESVIWKLLDLKIIHLTQNIRQENDSDFCNMLLNLRFGNCSTDIYNKLYEHHQKTEKMEFGDTDIRPTVLYSNNANVDYINNIEHNKLKSVKESKIYKIYYNKHHYAIDKYIQDNNINKHIELCISDQVIITYNISIEDGLANGTRGIVIDISSNDSVTLKLLNGEEVVIEYQKVQIDILNSNTKEYVLSFLPIKLAYSITIHKCCSENTLIYTTNGLKRIKKISYDNNKYQKSNTVSNLNFGIVGKIETTNALQIFKGNVKNTLEITTNSGFMIEATGNHILLTLNKYKESWKKISNICNNDLVLLKYNTNCYGNDICIKSFIKEYPNNPISKSKKFIDKELCFIIGMLYDNNNFTKDPVFNNFLLWCGIKNTDKYNKKVPWVILENTKICQIHFIKGVFHKTDTLQNKNLTYYTHSKDFAIDINNILLNMGITTNIKILDDIYKISIDNYDTVFIDIKNNIKVQNTVDIMTNLKKELLAYYKLNIDYKLLPYKLYNIINSIIDKKINITFDTLYKLSRKIKNINKFGKTGLFIDYITKNNIFYDSVINITKSVNKVYDLYIPSDNTYIGNGILNHNSQGMTIDYLSIDLGKSIFEYGQGYTGLSRARTLESVVLTDISKNSFKCHEKVMKFYNIYSKKMKNNIRLYINKWINSKYKKN